MKCAISRRWIVFSLASLLFLLSQFYRASVAVITPELIAAVGLDTRQLSLVSAAFFYAFALTQIPIGIYLDRLGPRRTMTALSIIAAIGALVFAWAESFGMLLLGRILMGVGMACNLMGSLKLLTLWFGPARFATLAALVVSIGTGGNLMAATPLVLLVQSFGWRVSFTLFSAVNLVLVIFFFSVVTDRPERGPGAHSMPAMVQNMRDTLSGIIQLFRTRDYWIISLGTFCRYGIFASVQALWAGPFLRNVMHQSAIVTGNMIFLMNIGLVIGGPLCGYLSDHIWKTRKGVIIMGLIGMAAVLLALAFTPTDIHTGVLSILFFLCGAFSSAGMVMYPHIKERVSIEKAGAAMTGINFFTMAGAAVFLQGLGSMMQRFFPGNSLGPSAFQTVFVICALCLIGIAVVYTRSKETHEG
jgi:sugar phosphate permease